MTPLRHNKTGMAIGYGLLMAVALLLGCRGTQGPVVAHLRTVQGALTVKVSDEAEPQPGEMGQNLMEGNIVTTGPDGQATVEFAGKNQIQLQPDTVLLIQKAQSSTAQFGAVILSGGVTASSSGQGVMLAVGTPFGWTEMGQAEASVEFDLQHGVTVLVGEVLLLTEDGNRQALLAGSTFTIDGLVVQLTEEADDESHMVLEPLKFVLLSNPKQVQIKRRGEETWRSPRKREVLAPGDAVRTRQAGGTKVQFGELAGLTLTAHTEMVFAEAGEGESAHRAGYELVSGQLQVQLRQDDKVAAKHQMAVAGLTLDVEPGLREANVEVNARPGGQTQVKVRAGRVSFPNGTVVHAGTSVNIDPEGQAGELRPLAHTDVLLRPKTSAILYYQDEIPAVAFRWEEDPNSDHYDLEIAFDPDFKKIYVQERLTAPSFVHDRLRAGRLYWRIKGSKADSKGTLLVQKKRESGVRIKRRNFVDDTGEKTVLYYQKTLPSIALRWKAVEGASRYHLRVYPDGEFDNPMISQETTAPQAPFKEGRFPEGKYYWHQTARDQAGQDLKTGRMNTLQIAYDNALTDLEIKNPRSGHRTSAKALVTRGEVQLGAKVQINGEAVNQDRKGRFRHTVRLDKGSNQIIYRTVARDGIERYYARRVFRR